jgi:hypothetical protein
VNPNFYVELVTLRSAKSVRKDKTFADVLMMNAVPVGQTPDITMKQAEDQADLTVGDFGPPARVNGNQVSTRWSPVGFSNGISLTINSSFPRGVRRLDKLSGSEAIEDSSVGNYKINYQCDALVVDVPSLVIDQTTEQ